VTYTNGYSWSTSIDFFARKYPSFGFAAIHRDCWRSVETDTFYTNVFSPVPQDVAYSSTATRTGACTP
jgi:hypothetical protein